MKQAKRRQPSGPTRIERTKQLHKRAAEIKLPAKERVGDSCPGPDVVERILVSDRLFLLARLSPSLAHEIINPVSAVINLATLMQHILKDDGIPPGRVPEFRGYLSQLIGESGRAGRIASEMLAFARGSGCKPARTEVNEMVRHAVSLASHMFKTEDVETRLDLGEGLPMIHCERSRIEHAMLHMLLNAAEAVEGRALRRVTVQTMLRNDGRAVTLRILDTGVGIRDEQIPRIFEPFFTTKQKPGNLGLGLTIARRLLSEEQATISVESRKDEGTAFMIEVPVRSSGEAK